jgi:hypothetical protein
MMKRTQIYFPEQLAEDIRLGARLRNISTSEYIRQLLEKRVSQPVAKITRRPPTSLSVLAKNAINLGPADLSKNFRKYFEQSL